jgi:peptide deformylase
MTELKKYPNPILRKKSEEVGAITAEIKSVILEMLKIMIKNQGAGIAAPQIGISKRIIAINTKSGPEVFINPKICKIGKETEIIEEGCLSFPGLWLKIKRAKEAEIEFLNEAGERIQTRVEGSLARVFQHEIDHLNGVLFIDRVSFWQRLKIRKKLRELAKNKNAAY